MNKTIFTILLTGLCSSSIAAELKDNRQFLIDAIQAEIEKDYDVTFKKEEKEEKEEKVDIKKLKRDPIKKVEVKKETSLMDEALTWTDKKVGEVKKWNDEQLSMLKNWERQKTLFNKSVESYKLTTEQKNNIVDIKEIDTTRILKNLKTVDNHVADGTFIIPGGFSFDVKNQKSRPTCSSFASIRAIEIVDARKGSYRPLSEQYFYYSSLPKCQKQKCESQGSAYYLGVKESLESSSANIPLEANCPYIPVESKGNTTQIPLKPGCFKGAKKVADFKVAQGLDETIKSLKAGYPVIASYTLSPNFYQNNGYVFLHDKKLGRMDRHSGGHAIVHIGYMPLPKSMHFEEGTYCLITANSWGTGWGKGGHACLSENWLKAHTRTGNNVVITAVQ